MRPACIGRRVVSACLLLACVVACLAAAPPAWADYVQASRQATVRSAPDRNAEVVITLKRGDRLLLQDDTQQNGYYSVTLSDGSHGWVYRTFVRRFRGGLPPDSTPVPATDAASDPARAAPRSFDRGVLYACAPVAVSAASSVQALDKTYFQIGYSDSRGNPLWTCYAIGPATDLIAYPRRRFTTDNQTKVAVSHDDYTGTDYSRGHMAPRFAISSRFGKAGNDATFIMSNVCPQYQDFNDGPWGELEEQIAGRKNGQKFTKGWADQYGKVWVTVGPIFEPADTRIDGRIEVPAAFYCIVVDEEAGRPRALAFILEHLDSRDGDLVRSLRSIDEIEKKTGLDFFRDLPDSVEVPLEQTVATGLWPLPSKPNER